MKLPVQTAPMVVILFSALLLSACQILPSQSSSTPSGSPTTMTENSPSPVTDSGTGVTVTSDQTGKKFVDVLAEYQSPAGPEKVEFKLIVDSNGVVTEGSMINMAQAPISKTRQDAFAKDFPMVIKGKKISELTSIDRVGGSSLTTNAFNQALQSIQAKL